MSVAHHAKSAVLWNGAFFVFREVILKFGLMVVLRRVLTQADYGVNTLVNPVMGFISMFAFNNIAAYTLQVRDEKDTHWQEQFTAGAVIQTAMFLLTNAVAVAMRWFPAYAPIAPYLHAMSPLYLLDLPCEIRRKMIERQFDWKRLRILHSIGIIIGAGMALGLAWAGLGAYALLLPVMALTFPYIYDLFVSARWRPTWAWSWEAYKPAWKFGMARVGSGLAFRGRQLIESAVMVVPLGLAGLGVLGCALGLAQLFCQTISEQLLGSIYPVLTRVNPDPQNVARVNGLVLRIVAWVTVPMAVALAALAVPVVNIYGPHWGAAVPLVPWAVLVGVGVALGHTANTLLLSLNQLRLCLIADLMLLLGAVVVLAVVLPYGVTAYLMGSALLQGVALLFMLGWLVERGGLARKDITNALLPTVVAAGLAYAACTGLIRLTALDANRLPVAIGYGGVFWLAYLAVLRVGFAGPMGELMAYVPGRKYLNRIFRFAQS
ncbi:MAG: hypothetical protein EBS05_25660 [Proteobacteria bacterium]|nr:hypothetical protein [Pseudomonadota bacterium]